MSANHQPRVCLLDRLLRRRSKNTPKLRVNGRWPVNFPNKGSVTRKMFPFDDVTMNYPMGVIFVVVNSKFKDNMHRFTDCGVGLCFLASWSTLFSCRIYWSGPNVQTVVLVGLNGMDLALVFSVIVHFESFKWQLVCKLAMTERWIQKVVVFYLLYFTSEVAI